MHRTFCVMALVALCAGLAHSFSWEIVTAVGNRLEFIDANGTLTHTENMEFEIYNLSYDPVHKKVLFADLSKICSFDITAKKTDLLIRVDSVNRPTSLAYDPATELLFWVGDGKKINSISLKQELKNSKVNEKQFILSEKYLDNIAVDSCGGFIYGSENFFIHRARFNGSETELIIGKTHYQIHSLTIDQKSQKMYWAGKNSIQSADLNGNNVRTITTQILENRYNLAISMDFIYGRSYNKTNYRYTIWQIPKGSPPGSVVEPKLFIERVGYITDIVANYNIEDITQENQNCDTLKSLLPNNSVSTDNPVHGTKVSEESRCECTQGYSGERCDVPVCHNYCLHGDCSASAEGEPKCRCNHGFSGERCEINLCQGYCLNDGVCSLSVDSKPLCQCARHYEGERCEFPVFLIKCSQTISMLREILNTDVSSNKWV